MGLTPAQIGVTLAVLRAAAALGMTILSKQAVTRFGEKRVYMWAMKSFLGLWIQFPLINWMARRAARISDAPFPVPTRDGQGWVWIGVASLVVPMMCMDAAYVCIYSFVTSSAPAKHRLGATNGLAQMVVAPARMSSPALATALFSYSVESGWVGGYGMYVVFWVVSWLGIWVAGRLPDRAKPLWEGQEQEVRVLDD